MENYDSKPMKNLLYLLFLICNIGFGQAVLDPSLTSLTLERFNESRGKFDLNSNTTWVVTSPQPWLKVWVSQIWPQPDGSKQYTQFYSGNAPDIGAFEYLESKASGENQAIVVLQAEANTTGVERISLVTLTGTNATTKTITVTQQALKASQSTLGKLIRSNGRLIIKK